MFIQMVQGACARPSELHRLVDDWCADMAAQPGWLGGTYGFDDTGHFYGVVRFDSEEACRACAERTTAAWWWAAAAALFEDAPEIRESGDVTILMDGGSDDAGFVQIIRGRVKDPGVMRQMMTGAETVNMLHAARPEIIGGTMVIEADGSFIETISFTDERAARLGETVAMPASLQQEFESAMDEMSFVDLHRPWFGSHR